ncbi:MAG: hypothetical protein JWR20_284 [Marmoricola sp.]|nr:hypothetical protein [Marmoricola sp.]
MRLSPRLARVLRAAVPVVTRELLKATSSTPAIRPTRVRRPARRAASTAAGTATNGREIGWDPRPDGRPDPGEVCWAWVPFEEDASQGKDRPVLVVGRDGADLLALQLTSKDHDRDAEQERRAGRLWTDVGTGDWDAQRRPSEVRLNRLLRLSPDRVRREGAALDRATFDRVVAEARPYL